SALIRVEDNGTEGDPTHALVLSGVCDISDEVLQEVLSSVKILGKTRIVDKRSDLTSKTDFVLVQTLTNVTEHTLPDQVGVPGEVGPWPVHIIPLETEHQGDFQAKLLSFLEHEGKSMSDVKGLLNPSSLDVNTALINAISSLVDKCNAAPADIQSYRKLRMFSGVRPTPSGEEEYDAWAEQTTHMLEEWQCSDSVKKQRVVESLKGPAADIIRFLRVQNPKATANDYMQALETAFGTTETSSDLLVKFRHTFQSEGEKLSTYLLRLDKLLHCIFRKGGLQLADMNRLRIEQVVRGALPHDMIAMRIRMTHKLRPPPSFNDLLKDVREEEDMLQGRTDAKSMVMSKPVTSVPKPAPENKADPEVEKLKRELREIKAEMNNLKVATVATAAAQTEPKCPKLDNTTKNRYQRNITSQRSKNTDLPGIFCYRCGEDGHYMRDCDGVENLQRVNKRLIKLTKKSGNYQGAQ
uniref:CCHC-type domain-containing protein n=1 Tax=Gouania willdenowi TaxID=441366 RepID=A0A8C5E1V7_GOUWI